MSVKIITGDCRAELAKLPAESVQCVVTSPPYFGLRDYGVEGQIGLEATMEAYVATMVDVFREVRRVLRKDGTVWLNLGDSHANDGKWGGSSGGKHVTALHGDTSIGRRKKHTGLKPKDLMMIPARVALALQADGWWLRRDIIWGKPNGMPDSAEDRPGPAHEYVFLLSKSARYFYDFEAAKLPAVPKSVGRLERKMREVLREGGDAPQGNLVVSGGGYAPPGQPPHQGARKTDKQRGHSRRHAGFNSRWDQMSREVQMADGARLRDVWWLAPAQYKDAHFAVMPSTLAAACILAGCPEGGTVLDPFGGAGTTGLVADRLGRNSILIELSPEYAAMAHRRIEGDAPLLTEVSG